MSFTLREPVSTALICQSSAELSKPRGLTARKDRKCTRWKCVHYEVPKPQEADLSPWPLYRTSCWPFAALFPRVRMPGCCAVSEYDEVWQVREIWFWEYLLYSKMSHTSKICYWWYQNTMSCLNPVSSLFLNLWYFDRLEWLKGSHKPSKFSTLLSRSLNL